MSKKLGWLDKFAEEQAAKMEKTASLNKKAEQIIVDTDEIPGAEAGKEVTYKGAAYKVVDANYKDEIGVGVVLEKIATEVTAGVEEQVPTTKCEVCGNDPCTCEGDLTEKGIPDEGANNVNTLPDPTGAPVEEKPVVPMNPVTPNEGIPGQKKVTDAPEMARTNPGDVYHIEVRDTVEVQKFEGEAAETAANISAEDAVDGTTPAGKINRILQRIQNPTSVVPAVEENPVEEVKEEIPTEEVKEEVPATEEPVVEEVKEEVPAEEGEENSDEDLKAKMANNRIFKKIVASLK